MTPPPTIKFKKTNEGYVRLRDGVLFSFEEMKKSHVFSKSIEKDQEGNEYLIMTLSSH